MKPKMSACGIRGIDIRVYPDAVACDPEMGTTCATHWEFWFSTLFSLTFFKGMS